MDKKKKKLIYIISFLVSGIIIIQIIIGFSIYHAFRIWPDKVLFEDIHLTINALFSGLAFAGVIYTILLQKHKKNQKK